MPSMQSFIVENFDGGLNTRENPLVLKNGQNGPMESPDMRNCDFFPTGSVSKRAGKTRQGNQVNGLNTWLIQLNDVQFQDSAVSYTAAGVKFAGCQLFTAPTSQSVTTITVKMNFQSNINANLADLSGFQCVIRNNNVGTPGATVLGTSAQLNPANYSINVDSVLVGFNFLTPVSLTGGTIYHFCIEGIYNPRAGGSFEFDFNGQTNNTAYRFNHTSDNYATFGSKQNDMYYYITATAATTNIQGLYDFKTYSPTANQSIMAACGGSLYYKNGSNWTSIQSGLAAGQNLLFDFCSFVGYLFSCDYATSTNRVWDQNTTNNATMQMGYRMSSGYVEGAFTLSDNNVSGSLSAGVYQVLFVTQLKSGGYRCHGPVSVTIAAGGSHLIAFGNINLQNETNGTQCGFDIGANASQVFMTDVNEAIFYKVPGANLGATYTTQPLPNNVAAANLFITATTNLTTSNTLLQEYSFDQAYFTSQVDTPKAKYLQLFQNFLCAAGDPSNTSRLWISQLLAPNIWSTFGQTYGSYLDIAPNDGDQITGLKMWQGRLYVFKQHSVWLIDYTGNLTLPFTANKLQGDIGCLSHWTIKEIPGAILFISERGPAICYGVYVMIHPAASDILDNFVSSNANGFNLSAMTYSTAMNNPTKMQIYFGVSSKNAAIRDMVLLFDYENNIFWLDDSIGANYFAEISDITTGFKQPWSGDYSATVYQHDTGLDDYGYAINWYISTPHMQSGNIGEYSTAKRLYVSGTVQATGTLSIDEYVDYSSTASNTYTIDMSDPNFAHGISIPMSSRAVTRRLVFRNSQLDVPVQLNGFRMDVVPEGEQL